MKFLLRDCISPLYKYLKSSRVRVFYSFLARFNNKGRYKKVENISFDGYSCELADGPSFTWQYKEIFVDQVYGFNSKRDVPVIFDCGANIGMSVIFFKHSHPKSRILAFEADPKIFSFLDNNIKKNSLSGVTAINSAVWTEVGQISFQSEGADGGALQENGDVTVNSIRLRDFLLKEDYIDLLKIDIEGAELDVIKDCADALDKVDRIFLEFHSFGGNKQKLSELLHVLEINNFRYHLQSLTATKTPFLMKKASPGKMDLQVNIYAYRD